MENNRPLPEREGEEDQEEDQEAEVKGKKKERVFDFGESVHFEDDGQLVLFPTLDKLGLKDLKELIRYVATEQLSRFPCL